LMMLEHVLGLHRTLQRTVCVYVLRTRWRSKRQVNQWLLGFLSAGNSLPQGAPSFLATVSAGLVRELAEQVLEHMSFVHPLPRHYRGASSANRWLLRRWPMPWLSLKGRWHAQDVDERFVDEPPHHQELRACTRSAKYRPAPLRSSAFPAKASHRNAWHHRRSSAESGSR